MEMTVFSDCHENLETDVGINHFHTGHFSV